MKAILYEIGRWAAVAAAVLLIASATGGHSALSDVNPQDVLDAVCDSADMTNMQPAPNQTVKRFFGIDPSEYEFCALYYPLTNMDVDELLLIKYADAAQEEQVRKAVEARLTGQENVFESYGVGQMELLTNHSVYLSESGFAFFIVNQNADKAQTAFTDAIRGK